MSAPPIARRVGHAPFGMTARGLAEAAVRAPPRVFGGEAGSGAAVAVAAALRGAGRVEHPAGPARPPWTGGRDMEFAIGRRVLFDTGLRPRARGAAPAWPLGGARSGPAGEGASARALRWLADRRRLAQMDPRLLRDVGLTPQDVRRGTPFR